MTLIGLFFLTVPGKRAPDLLAALLMAMAGVFWGVYSLRGGRAEQALLATAGNFVLAVPSAVCLSLLALPSAHVARSGGWLAVISGAVTSGIGYSFWYGALPALGSTRAAIVQLSVPVLAMFAGVLILGESWSARALGSGALTLVGVSIAILGRRPRTG